MKNDTIIKMNEIMPGMVYTVPELASCLRIANQTVRNKLSRGENLPKCFRVGNQVRFLGKDILQFIADQQD